MREKSRWNIRKSRRAIREELENFIELKELRERVRLGDIGVGEAKELEKWQELERLGKVGNLEKTWAELKKILGKLEKTRKDSDFKRVWISRWGSIRYKLWCLILDARHFNSRLFRKAVLRMVEELTKRVMDNGPKECKSELKDFLESYALTRVIAEKYLRES